MAAKSKRASENDDDEGDGALPSRPGLSEAQRRQLLALPREIDRPPDRPVVEMVLDCRGLEAIVGRDLPALRQRTRLDPRVAEGLGERREALEVAEGAWMRHRLSSLTVEDRRLRLEAEEELREALAAVRYLLRGDAAARDVADHATVDGSLADLAHDLRLVGRLVEQAGRALAGAGLPRTAADRLRRLSLALTARVAPDREGALLLSLRNRAFWHLVAAMDEIVAAGRWAFRGQPLAAARYRRPTR